MKKYVVNFIDGHDLHFKSYVVYAENEQMAVTCVYRLFGDFDHWISSVQEA